MMETSSVPLSFFIFTHVQKCKLLPFLVMAGLSFAYFCKSSLVYLPLLTSFLQACPPIVDKLPCPHSLSPHPTLNWYQLVFEDTAVFAASAGEVDSFPCFTYNWARTWAVPAPTAPLEASTQYGSMEGSIDCELRQTGLEAILYPLLLAGLHWANYLSEPWLPHL